MSTPKQTPAEAAYNGLWPKPSIAWKDNPAVHQAQWGQAAQAAITTYLSQVAEGLPTVEEVIEASNGWDEKDQLSTSAASAILNLFAERFAKLEAERDMWKANHDNQVALRRTLMDRPDLGDRAKRMAAMIEERNKMWAQISALSAERDALAMNLNNSIAFSGKAQLDLANARHTHKNALENVRLLGEENADLRQQLTEAHDACDSFAIRNDSAGYPEGAESRDLSLVERINAATAMIADCKRWLTDAEGKPAETPWALNTD